MLGFATSDVFLSQYEDTEWRTQIKQPRLDQQTRSRAFSWGMPVAEIEESAECLEHSWVSFFHQTTQENAILKHLEATNQIRA
jgi:hypothetical protein